MEKKGRSMCGISKRCVSVWVLCVVCALCVVSCRDKGRQRPAKVRRNIPLPLPKSPKKRVLVLYRSIGTVAALTRRKSGPDLAIYADGRVVIHDPFGLASRERPNPKHIPRISGKITRKQVLALLHEIINEQDFLSLNPRTLHTKTGGSRFVTGAGTTTLTIELDKKRRHSVWVHSLDRKALRRNSPPGIQRMAHIVERLLSLRERIRQHYKTSPRKAPAPSRPRTPARPSPARQTPATKAPTARPTPARPAPMSSSRVPASTTPPASSRPSSSR